MYSDEVDCNILKLYKEMVEFNLIDKVNLLPETGVKVSIYLLLSNAKNKSVWENVASQLLDNALSYSWITDVSVLLKVDETLKSIGLHEHPLTEFVKRLKTSDSITYWFSDNSRFSALVEVMVQSTLLDVKVDDYLIKLLNQGVKTSEDKVKLLHQVKTKLTLNTFLNFKSVINHWKKHLDLPQSAY